MLHVQVYGNDPTNNWLVQQFEAYYFSSGSVTEKFIPRPYISVVFHFNDRPLIIEDQPIELGKFFCAPIIPRAINLQFRGEMDTFTVTCNASVFFQGFQSEPDTCSREKHSSSRKYLFTC